MSTRTTIRPMVVINAVSMASSITSLVTVLQSVTKINYTYSWTGTSPVGTISVQVSNDYSLLPNGTVNNSGSWTSLYLNVNGTPSTTIAISGNTGSGTIDVETAAYAIRTIYTFASGIGNLTAVINGKIS